MMAPPLKSAVASRDGSSQVSASVDIHMVALMRCLLTVVVLVAVSADGYSTAAPALLPPPLFAYAVYSLALWAAGFRGWTMRRAEPWVDVIFYVYLIALTHGGDSIFFHCFLFPIVAAAFSRGFREGLGVTMFAVLSFVA